MIKYLLPGRYLWRKAQRGGVDVLYQSFNRKIVIYHCWTNDKNSAGKMVDDLNAVLFSEFVDGEVKIETKIEKTQQLIKRNRSSQK